MIRLCLVICTDISLLRICTNEDPFGTILICLGRGKSKGNGAKNFAVIKFPSPRASKLIINCIVAAITGHFQPRKALDLGFSVISIGELV